MLRLRDTILIQVMLAGVMWVFLWNFNPFKTSAQGLMAGIDTKERTELFERIDQLSKSRALTQNGEVLLEQKVDALCAALNWEKKRFQVYPRLPVDGVVPVDIRMELGGSPGQIPIFIEGLKYMPFLGVLHKLELNIKERTFVFQLRFFRTQPKIPSWIDKQSDLSQKDRAVLRQGFLLMYWKSVQKFFVQEHQQNPLNDPYLRLEISRKITLKQPKKWEKGQEFYR